MQVPSTKTSVLGRSTIMLILITFVVELFAETVAGISDEVQKLYNFVSVLVKSRILGSTEDHIL
jgi:hypothetical protein